MNRCFSRAAFAVALTWVAYGCDGGSDPAGPNELDTFGLATISESEALSTAGLEDLTDEQREAVRAAYQAAREQILAILARLRAGEIDQQVARAEIEAVHATLMQALEGILTPDQLANLPRRGPRHRGPGGPGGPAGIGQLREADLDDDQKEEIRELLEAFREFAQALRRQVANGALTHEEARAQFRTAAQELRQAICGILTPEQQAVVRYCAD